MWFMIIKSITLKANISKSEQWLYPKRLNSKTSRCCSYKPIQASYFPFSSGRALQSCGAVRDEITNPKSLQHWRLQSENNLSFEKWKGSSRDPYWGVSAPLVFKVICLAYLHEWWLIGSHLLQLWTSQNHRFGEKITEYNFLSTNGGGFMAKLVYLQSGSGRKPFQ